jgi:hypothetical protein
MRLIITVECVGEDGQKSTFALGTIERVGGTVTENVGVNLEGSKQILHRLHMGRRPGRRMKAVI